MKLQKSRIIKIAIKEKSLHYQNNNEKEIWGVHAIVWSFLQMTILSIGTMITNKKYKKGYERFT